jgi:hypothetical protein
MCFLRQKRLEKRMDSAPMISRDALVFLRSGTSLVISTVSMYALFMRFFKHECLERVMEYAWWQYCLYALERVIKQIVTCWCTAGVGGSLNSLRRNILRLLFF